MAEATGLVISLVGVVKTWVDLQHLVTTGNNVARDLKSFMTYVDTERVAFRLWCDVMEMGPLAEKIEAAVKEGSLSSSDQAQQEHEHEAKKLITKLPAYAPHHIGQLLLSGSRATMLAENIERIMLLKKHTLEETRTFLRSYGAQVRKRDRLKNHLGLGRKDELRHLGPLLRRESDLTKEYHPDLWDAARWAASGRQESIRLLEDLTRCNHGLQRLLDLMNKEAASQLKREMRAAATTATTGPTSGNMQYLLPQASFEPSFEELWQVAQTQQRFSRQPGDRMPGAAGAFAAFSSTSKNEAAATSPGFAPAHTHLGIHKNRQEAMVELFTSRRKRYSTKSRSKPAPAAAVAAAVAAAHPPSSVATAAANEMIRVRLRVPHSALIGLLQPHRMRKLMRYR
ncbi:hypothetical protein QBC44DRAFT_394511 [Cladorrhinum sp. PSN332]|nr:hypothetical protein QBC44DRAFT_394511 [Cladorrhinum sp. PSN332]